MDTQDQAYQVGPSGPGGLGGGSHDRGQLHLEMVLGVWMAPTSEPGRDAGITQGSLEWAAPVRRWVKIGDPVQRREHDCPSRETGKAMAGHRQGWADTGCH